MLKYLSMHEIIPAILPKSEDDLKEKIAALPPEITFIHFDVLEEDIWISIPQDFEVHLMVENPEKIFARWIERGAKRISTHKVDPSLAKYRDRAEIGLAVELDKPLDEVMPFLDFVDYIHLMSIDEIGEQGHPLNERIFARLAELQEKFPNTPISIDGGVNKNNYQKLLELGADRLIVGSGFKELWQTLKTS
jgi:pentose-5-phosphate-3-epimerase